MRMLSGRLRLKKWAAKRRTEASELRSSSITLTEPPPPPPPLPGGMLFMEASTRSLTAAPRFKLRAPITTRAPRLASTRAASSPIPDVAPILFIYFYLEKRKLNFNTLK